MDGKCDGIARCRKAYALKSGAYKGRRDMFACASGFWLRSMEFPHSNQPSSYLYFSFTRLCELRTRCISLD